MTKDDEVITTIQVVNPERYEILGLSYQAIRHLRPFVKYVVLTEKGFTSLTELPSPPRAPFEAIEVIQKTETEIRFEISDYDDFGTDRLQKVESFIYVHSI